MNSSLSIISIGIGGWLGAFYSASLLADAAPFHVEKVANILSGPLFGGILAHAIVAAVGTLPFSFGRVYAAMFTSVPLAFLAVVSIVYVFAVLGFRAFYEMQVKTVAQMAADEIAADAAEAAAAAAADPLPESDDESELEETESEGESESESESEDESEGEGSQEESEAEDESEAVETTAVSEDTHVEETTAAAEETSAETTESEEQSTAVESVASAEDS
jgi:cytoskeletal protein RodZ